MDDSRDEKGRLIISFIDRYDFLTCCGCGHYSLRQSTWLDVTSRKKPKGDPAFVKHYPPAVSRRRPDWLDAAEYYEAIPDDLRDILDEIYSALHSHLTRLAASGIRTAIDMIMVEKISDVGDFGKKLSEFERMEYISKKQHEVLSIVINAGSASAHRGFNPSSEVLSMLMDVLEGIVASVYIHPIQAEMVKKKTPLRAKK
ncbi:MAG: DUF4145 domain-containing protein [Ferrovibrio sp.]|uniref:DUF4145 domain-containing protein n=1 Tax=Ferrovibrio sp. TaxID=1917215 RepID=UPI00260234FB|nr:DUF4145 domain-containing protein [Ferrovibrio sp.]MCW0234856.1 DUF4145 domain-containing protein [Ferrovibrio sp.]